MAFWKSKWSVVNIYRDNTLGKNLSLLIKEQEIISFTHNNTSEMKDRRHWKWIRKSIHVHVPRYIDDLEKSQIHTYVYIYKKHDKPTTLKMAKCQIKWKIQGQNKQIKWSTEMTNNTQSNLRKNLSLHQAIQKKETTYVCMRLVHMYICMRHTYVWAICICMRLYMFTYTRIFIFPP